MYEQDQTRGHEKASCEAQEVRGKGETAAARIREPAAPIAGCAPLRILTIRPCHVYFVCMPHERREGGHVAYAIVWRNERW